MKSRTLGFIFIITTISDSNAATEKNLNDMRQIVAIFCSELTQ